MTDAASEHRFKEWDENGDPVFYTDPTGWLLDAMNAGNVLWGTTARSLNGRFLLIKTPNGRVSIRPGDWIGRDASGKLFARKAA